MSRHAPSPDSEETSVAWQVTAEDDRVRVTGDLGEGATASWLVEVVRGKAVLVELHVSRPSTVSSDGLDSTLLRKAIRERGVIDEARVALEGERGATLMAALRTVWNDDPNDRDREILLTAVAYVAKTGQGSRRVAVDVAAVMGISERRVRHNIELGRDRGFIARSRRMAPASGHYRGVPDGILTQRALDALTPLIARRLGVPADGALFTSVKVEDGTAAELLRLLQEAPLPPDQDSGGVIVDGSGARLVPFETAFPETRPGPDGVVIRVLRR